MNPFVDPYRQLLSMVQSHLLIEYPRDQRFVSDDDTYQFYKAAHASSAIKTATASPHLETTHPPRFTPPSPLPRAVETVKPVLSSIAAHAAKPLVPPVAPPSISVVAKKESPSLQLPTREVEETIPLDDLSDIRAVVTKLYPQLRLSAPPTSDNKTAFSAGKIIDVYVLQMQNTLREEAFLHYLAGAINRVLLPAAVLDGFRVEKEKGWEKVLENSHLKLIVMSQSQLDKMEGLRAHFRRNPSDQTCTLGDIPLLLLPELQEIFQQSEKKFTLWKTLQTVLKNHVH